MIEESKQQEIELILRVQMGLFPSSRVAMTATTSATSLPGSVSPRE
jgi:hypothetical protein